MALHDFGTVRVFAGGDQVDVYFPKGYEGLRDLLKSFKGRWMPDRRGWRVVPQIAKVTSSHIVAKIEAYLIGAAPQGWEGVLPRISRFSCVTRKYELKVGAGGIRLTLPPGHPSDHAMKRIPGAQKDGESWLIPSASCVLPEMKPVLTRVVNEDRELFNDCMAYVAGRSIWGDLHLSGEEADLIGLAPGGIVFADLSFLQVADPQIPPAPILEYAYRVSKVDMCDTHITARLDYLEEAEAYSAIKARATVPLDSRALALNLSHARTKWNYKRR